MNTGACRRCLTTRSSVPLPMIGSVLAVQVTIDVELRKPLVQLGQRDRLGAEPVRRAGSPRSSVRLATVIERGRRLAKCVAASSIISPAPISSSRWSDNRREDALGELHRGSRHRDRCAADVGLRAHVLRDGERALEQPIQHQSERSRRLRRAHRLLHLPEDLRLAQHHRIEAARDAKRMRHRAIAVQRIDVRRQRGRRQPVRAFEPARDGVRLTAMEIHLGAIAGRQDRGFLDHPPRMQARAARRTARQARTSPARARRAARWCG